MFKPDNMITATCIITVEEKKVSLWVISLKALTAYCSVDTQSRDPRLSRMGTLLCGQLTVFLSVTCEVAKLCPDKY